MRALILAAGNGMRMGQRTPKALISFAGRSLLEWQLKVVRNYATEIGVVVQSNQTAFESYRLVTFRHVRSLSTNMVDSLFCAKSWLDGSEDLLVSYSDIIYHAEVISQLVSHQPDIMTIPVNLNWKELWLARFSDPLSDAESLKLDHNGRVIHIGQHVDTYDDIDAQYMGLIYLPAQTQAEFTNLWLQLGRVRTDISMTEYLNLLIRSGSAISTSKTEGGWLEFDNVTDVHLYQSMLEDATLDRFIDMRRI